MGRAVAAQAFARGHAREHAGARYRGFSRSELEVQRGAEVVDEGCECHEVALDRLAQARARHRGVVDAAPGGEVAAAQVLDELLFRYRARNWPELLAPAERERWDAFRRARLAPGSGLASPDLARFETDLATLRAQHAGDAAKLALLGELESWRAQIGLPAPGTTA
jgi:hypothetical protein